MNHCLSTHFFASHRLTTVWLERIWQAGIPSVEIFCARQHLDYYNSAQASELAHWFRDSELKLHALHAPIYTDDVWGRSGPNSVINITELSKPRRLHALGEIKRALEVTEDIPMRYLIQHLGVSGEEYDDAKVEAAFSSLEDLSLFARGRGVEVLLENIPNGFSTSERLNGFLHETHLDLNFCFDVGHANIGEGVENAFQTMKDRIRSTHIHDNDGETDAHILPLLGEGGSIDWKKTMELLRSRADQYPLLLELKEDPAIEKPIVTAKEVFDQLESL